ncbi:MAG: hypothetical protein ABID40_04860, partial [Candidatus Bipolaricaulota bacterium]
VTHRKKVTPKKSRPKGKKRRKTPADLGPHRVKIIRTSPSKAKWPRGKKGKKRGKITSRFSDIKHISNPKKKKRKKGRKGSYPRRNPNGFVSALQGYGKMNFWMQTGYGLLVGYLSLRLPGFVLPMLGKKPDGSYRFTNTGWTGVIATALTGAALSVATAMCPWTRKFYQASLAGSATATTVRVADELSKAAGFAPLFAPTIPATIATAKELLPAKLSGDYTQDQIAAILEEAMQRALDEHGITLSSSISQEELALSTAMNTEQMVLSGGPDAIQTVAAAQMAGVDPSSLASAPTAADFDNTGVVGDPGEYPGSWESFEYPGAQGAVDLM